MLSFLKAALTLVVAATTTAIPVGHALAGPHPATVAVHRAAPTLVLDPDNNTRQEQLYQVMLRSLPNPVWTEFLPPPPELPADSDGTPSAAPGQGTPTAGQGAPAAAGHASSSAPAPRPQAPAPPPLVIGSTQQALINGDRTGAGLAPLTWSSCLAGVAYQNAVRMANAGAISHAGGVRADFGCGLGSSQTGENVGYWSGGINDAQLNVMFMNSPEHHANIMGPYRYVGTAWVVGKTGAGYVAVEFG